MDNLRKRKREGSLSMEAAVDSSSPSGHYSRSNRPYTDESYGQRGALPLVYDPEEDDSDSAEAINYLRSVRYEADDLPALLTVPSEYEAFPDEDSDEEGEIDESQPEDVEAYYHDGVFISRLGSATHNEMRSPPNGLDLTPSSDPRDVYHTALVQRFLQMRKAFTSVSKAKDEAFSIDESKKLPLQILRWKHLLQSKAPTPRQLVSLSTRTVKWLLTHMPEILNRAKWRLEVLNSEDATKARNLSAWIWGLLGTLDDVGTLHSEEVSILRELAKSAGGIILGLESGEELGTENDVDFASSEQDGISVTVWADGADSSKPTEESREQQREDVQRRRRNTSSPLEDAPSHASTSEFEPERSAARTTESSTADMTSSEAKRILPELQILHMAEEIMKGTLDMILTIVGECYGQSDLLVARDLLWESARSIVHD